jgi:hypothetical protein
MNIMKTAKWVGISSALLVAAIGSTGTTAAAATPEPHYAATVAGETGRTYIYRNGQASFGVAYYRGPNNHLMVMTNLEGFVTGLWFHVVDLDCKVQTYANLEAPDDIKTTAVSGTLMEDICADATADLLVPNRGLAKMVESK